VLWRGSFGQSVLSCGVPDSTGLESVGDPGPGRWVTIYANAGHAYIAWRALESVRIAAAGPDRYMVTGPVDNFLVGTTGSRWPVVSPSGRESQVRDL
jgi:hypothetical protein